MNSFFERLEQRVQQVDSLLCVGVDAHLQDLPGDVPAVQAVEQRCLNLMRQTSEHAAAYKINAAFFEVFGSQGIAALQRLIATCPPEIPVILDAKRGDIASSAQAYAQAAFKTLGAQALTVNPYLGYDAIEPFLENPQHGVFLLCKTSNPGADDLQELQVSPAGLSTRRLYEHVASLAQSWNRLGNLGLVVGATQPAALHRVRQLAPDLWILSPGVGAQGGDLEAALQNGLRADGMGLLITVSRALSRASDPAQAANELRQAINHQRRQFTSGKNIPHQRNSTGFPLATLADALLDAGCIRFGSFTLKSGLLSPIYIDLRRLVSDPRLLARVAQAYQPLLQHLTFDRLAALPYAALPIATAISLQGSWSLIYPRKETKEYGTRAEIEGLYQLGEQVVIIDDLATTGGSKFEAIEKLTAAGLLVRDVVVLVDRESGARQSLAEAGFELHAVFTLNQLLDHWQATARVPPDQIQAVRQFLQP